MSLSFLGPFPTVVLVVLVSNDGLGRVKADDKLNFKKVFDDNNDIYNGEHYCEYVEIDDVSKLTTTSYFSTYSHNVRSLQGHFDDLVDLLDQAKPIHSRRTIRTFIFIVITCNWLSLGPL